MENKLIYKKKKYITKRVEKKNKFRKNFKRREEIKKKREK